MCVVNAVSRDATGRLQRSDLVESPRRPDLAERSALSPMQVAQSNWRLRSVFDPPIETGNDVVVFELSLRAAFHAPTLRRVWSLISFNMV